MINTQHKNILLRHAESEKNKKKIHGGHGEALTLHGIEQASAIAVYLQNSINCNNLKIYTSTSLHTTATAEIIADSLHKPLEKPLFFRPLYLGVADGVSEYDLQKLYPEVHRLFLKWRKQEIDIKQLIVPDMESYRIFWKRGIEVLKSFDTLNNCLVVCSNSLMILLTHIMLLHDPVDTNAYKHIPINNCDIIAFDVYSVDKYILDQELTTVPLKYLC